MKKWLLLSALVAAFGATPAQAADTGNWLSYLQITGCSCDYGSFSPSVAKFTVDSNGPQGMLGLSKSPITVSTGNQTQSVQVAISLNGVPVAATKNSSGQQSGVYYTSEPINLAPGSNLITITTSDPSFRLKPTVTTITVPYRPVVLANTAAPAVTGSPQAGQKLGCATGSWDADPAPSLTVTWERSTDGKTWTEVGSSTLRATDTGRFFRCKVVANNGFTTSTVYSDPLAIPDAPVVAPPTVTTPAPQVTPPTVTATATAAPAAAKTVTLAPVTVTSTGQVQTKAKTVTAAVKKWLKVHKPLKPIVVHRYTAAR